EAELAAKVLLHFAELVFAEHSVVDEDAGQAVSDGAVHEHGCDAGIDSAGEAANGSSLLSDCRFDLRDSLVDEPLRGPGGVCSADFEDEVAQEFRSHLRMVHFRMELNSPHATFEVLDAGDGA